MRGRRPRDPWRGVQGQRSGSWLYRPYPILSSEPPLRGESVRLRCRPDVVRGRAHDAIIVALLDDVARPTKNARQRKGRGEEVLRQSERQIHDTLVKLEVGAQRSFLVRGLRDERFIDGFQRLDQTPLMGIDGDPFRQDLDDSGARIDHAIFTMEI